jgi:RES domain-containing protein
VILWRISAFASLDGTGGLKYSARWHTAGRPVVYTADHPASALCEMLVHVDRGDLPDSFQLLKVAAPAGLAAERVSPPGGWLRDTAASRRLGDRWLERNSSLLLRVPSAIVPDAWNYLINPTHGDFAKLRIESASRVPLDERLR